MGPFVLTTRLAFRDGLADKSRRRVPFHGKQMPVSDRSPTLESLAADLATGKPEGALDLAKDGKATQLAITRDGKFVIAGTTGTKFIVWDLAKGERIFTS